MQRLAGALALTVCAAVPASAQSRELDAATRAQRLDVQRSLAARQAVKISVSRPGWYRVGQPQLVAAGLPPNVNPHNLRLFAEGVEQPLEVIGRSEGRFESGDAIEFYAAGVDTPFTGTRVYWLVSDSPGARVRLDDGRTNATGAERSFPFTVERRDRTILFIALMNGGGNKYFGDFVSADGPVDELLTVTHLDRAATDGARLEIGLQGINEDPTLNPNHRIGVVFNGADVGEIDFNGQGLGLGTFTVTPSQIVEGTNTVTLITRGGDLDFTAVDHVDLTYAHTYRAENDALRLSAAAGRPVTVDGFSTSDIRLVDITDPQTPRELLGTVRARNGGYAISAVPQGAGVRTLLAFTRGTLSTADAVRRNVPSTWSAASNAADYVIVTHGDFVDAATRLKALRESRGLQVALVDVEDLYDEFNFGEKSAQAIKDFLLRAHDVWRTPPRFLLLLGNATVDPRNYLGTGQIDYVPVQVVETTWLEVPSDDWYADTDLDGRPDLAAVGRLPARDVAQANAMVAKILAYEGAGEAGWTKDVLLVSDQNDDSDDFEGATSSLEPLISPDYQVHKILRGAVGTDAARADMLTRIGQGQLIVNYFGHGSVDMWDDDLMTGDDAATMTNGPRYPFVVAMSCLNGFFHTFYPDDSMAGSLMRASNGGAIAVWASSALTSTSSQGRLDRELFRLLFTGAYPTLGEAAAAAKKAAGDSDVRRSWILFGDPALHLKGLPLTPVTSRLTDAHAPAKHPVQPAPAAAAVPAASAHSQATEETRPNAAAEWQMLAVDVNGDGLADAILYHRGTGTWIEALTRPDGATTYVSGQWPAHATVRAVDLNGDGRTDVFLYQRATGAWLEGLADERGQFTYHTGSFTAGADIEFGDFNGDGRVDALLYNRDSGAGSIALSDGAGGFTSVDAPWPAGWVVRAADFNGDRVADGLLYDANTGAWMEGVNDGSVHFNYLGGGAWASEAEVYVGDFNGDGRSDVYLYNSSTGAWLLAVAGSPGQFTVTSGMSTPGWVVAVGDFNGDRRADLLFVDPETGQALRCFGAGDGTFSCVDGRWPRSATVPGSLK